MHALRTGLFAVLALGLGLAACQAYNMEEVDPQTIVAVETFGTYTRSKQPTLLVVQDRSGSMDACFDQSAFDGTTRGCNKADDTHDPIRRSRMEVAQDVMARIVDDNAADVRFGLVMYGYDPAKPGTNCGPPATVAEPGEGSATLVADAYRTSAAMQKPAGGTPTTEALRRAYDLLVNPETNKPKQADRANYVVLVTDGLMNCNAAHPTPCTCAMENIGCGATPYGEVGPPLQAIQCLDDDDAKAEVTRLAQAGVKTFVIGLGDVFGGKSLATDVLDALAVAGGVPQDGAQKFYSAADPAQLQASLEAIIKQISAPCDYVLDGPVCDGRLVKVSLRIGEDDGSGKIVTEDVATSCSPDPGDATWYFAGDAGSLDPQRIVFSPPLCKRLAEASKVEISIRGVENACTDETQGPSCSLATTP